MIRHLARGFVFLFLAMSSLQAHAAAETSEAIDFTIHQHFISARAMGMGGAFTAVADDYAALFYNPAGLGKLGDWQLNLEVRGMIDSDVIKFKNDIESANASGRVGDMVTLLESNYGKHYSSRLPTLGAYWVKPGFGIGITPLDLSLELEIHQAIGPAASVIGTQDTTIAVGYGREVAWGKKDKFAWGVTVNAIYRGYFNKSLTALELALDKNILRPQDAQEGMTVDGTLGLLWMPEIGESAVFSFLRWLKPNFGLAVRNVVDYGFTSNLHLINEHSKEPPKLGRRFDVGSMWELPDLWIFKTRFALDVRDMGHKNWTFKKGSHAGFEFLWKIFGWWQGGWRTGVSQGYFTAGFTGKFGIFMLDLATYAEEVGSSQSPKANRRYMAKASLDF